MYKAIVRDQDLPADLRIPNEETAAALRRSENDKNLIAFDNVEEMFEYLESEDDEVEDRLILVRTGTHSDLFQ